MQNVHGWCFVPQRALSTIFALSSAPGRSAIAVIRISGPETRRALQGLTKKGIEAWIPRRITLASIYHPSTSELLDKAMAVWFPEPSSYTGEDTGELYLHGGSAVVTGVLQALSCIQKCRPADPGEFSKRAFLNGKLDLTALEGVSDLIKAETSMQRKLALRQAGGQLYTKCQQWRQTILKAVAHLEAYIDFGEDEHIDDIVFDKVKKDCVIVSEEMQECVRSVSGERITDGIRLTIAGEPNVGKSSLFNILCEREAAIVSGVPGTTRDTLDVHLDIGGLPVMLTDTAGIRDTVDIVEKEGVRRAKLKIKESDMIIVLMEAESVKSVGYKEYFNQQLERLVVAGEENEISLVLVVNKMDLVNKPIDDMPDIFYWRQKALPVLKLSCIDNEYQTQFINELNLRLQSMYDQLSDSSMMITHTRQRQHLQAALNHLIAFHSLKQFDIVIAAQKLRNALFSVGKITGNVSTEDILDVIFSDFCIGK